MKTLFEEIRNHITAFELGGAIQDSFSHAELVRLIDFCGLVYPGVRLQSLDIFELSQNFAQDAWKDPEIFAFLETELNRKYAADIEEIRTMTLEEIRRILSGVNLLIKGRAVGKMIWVLLRDGRQELKVLVPPFMKSIFRHTGKKDREFDKKMDFYKRFEEGRLNPSEIKTLRLAFDGLNRENSGMEKELEEKQSRITALKQERDRAKEEVAVLRREGDRLKSAVGKLEKELSGQAETVRRLQETSRKMPQSEKEALEHRIHDLERTGRKQEHEILELRRQVLSLEAEMKAREGLCGRLKAEVGAASAGKKALEDELDRYRKAAERQTPKPPQASPAQTHNTPLQKGKRLGVFVDAGSLRFAAKQAQKKIDFRTLLETITGDRHLVNAVLYAVVFPGKDPARFFGMVERSGFEIRSRNLVRKTGNPEKGFWDTGIVTDAIRLADRNDLDIVHLVSGDGDFADLLKWLKARGVQTEVSAFPAYAAPELVKCADNFIELREDVFLTDITASAARAASG